jgi:hypothetical protein
MSTPAQAALAQQDQRHEQEQQGGQLRRSLQAEKAEPGFVDGGGKGVIVENRHRAEIGEGLHQCERYADDDRRARHRKYGAEKAAPRTQAEHARGLHRRPALGQECRAGEHVDIGIEHQHHDGDHAAARPDLGEPVSVRAEGLAQKGLQRPGKIEQAQHYKGGYIGGDGQRQHQGPLEEPPSGELAHGGQPGQADPDDQDAGGNAEGKDHCVAH